MKRVLVKSDRPERKSMRCMTAGGDPRRRCMRTGQQIKCGDVRDHQQGHVDAVALNEE